MLMNAVDTSVTNFFQKVLNKQVQMMQSTKKTKTLTELSLNQAGATAKTYLFSQRALNTCLVHIGFLVLLLWHGLHLIVS